jgi:hypothetical protein
MEIRFLDVAQHELDDTVEYYHSESPGLAISFYLRCLVPCNVSSSFQKRGSHSPKIAADAKPAGFLMA